MLPRISVPARMSSRATVRIVSGRTAVPTVSSFVRSLPLNPSTSSVTHVPVAPLSTEPDMFCYQCEQTDGGTGCTVVGVCGKSPEVAALQDLLVYSLKGVSEIATAARAAGAPENPALNAFVLEGMFSTLTNVNFDATRFVEFIEQSAGFHDIALDALRAAGGDDSGLSDVAKWVPASLDQEALIAEGRTVGVAGRRDDLGDTVAGLQELVIYGIKGTAAYAAHASELGVLDESVCAFVQETLADIDNITEVPDLLGKALATGGANVQALAALDSAHSTRFGDPAPTPVNHSPTEGHCILISGHDMADLEALLKQTEGTGVNVYTHGEMLPGHAYPELAKYEHLKGHYGTAWQLQRFDWSSFPGPVIITTNCLMEPRGAYKERLYTTGATGFEGIPHIEDRDFSAVVAKAKECKGFTATKEPKTELTGFGHKAVLGVADKVLAAAAEGNLKRIVLIGGCDGSEGERSYYTHLADALPEESLILTLGCGKYRLLGRRDYGTLPNTEIPRLLDMGQCNDSYSAVVVANALADALGTDVNGLPLSIALSWFEQKAVAVLLSLLHLGVRDIHIGPNLPAYITPDVLAVLQDKFNIQPIHESGAAGAAAFMSA